MYHNSQYNINDKQRIITSTKNVTHIPTKLEALATICQR